MALGAPLPKTKAPWHLDIFEEDETLMVEASVPGFQRDDIAIQLQGLLSIVASRPAQTDSGRHYYRRERPVGSWTRRIALPGVVHDAGVDAELRHGVLTLRIPVPSSAKPRQIQIRADEEATDVRSIEAESWTGDEEHAVNETEAASRN